MAVPTLDELHDYLTSVIDAKSHNGQHVVFEWNGLNTAAFRHFKSTSNAIGKRMRELVTDGRLVGVKVSNHGFVHLDHEEIGILYFRYHDARYGGSQYGYITHKRPQDHPNPWANGMRCLYTTKSWLDAMTTAFLEAEKRHQEKQREKRTEEESHVTGALNAIAPDACQLLERLEEVIPGIEKRVRSQSVAQEGHFFFSLDMYNAKEIEPFLDILRRGLPEAP